MGKLTDTKISEKNLTTVPKPVRNFLDINEGDIVVVEPWDWDDDKANIEWRYDGQDADQLRREGHLDGDLSA